MNDKLFPYLYGVDVAVKKLRPNAHFEFRNNIITQWNDPTGTIPPKWDEILEQIEHDKIIYEEQEQLLKENS